MKFEIINPSDEAYIEGGFKECCLATLFFGEGQYALKQEGGDLTMPLFLGGGHNEWLKKTFGKGLKELFAEIEKEDIMKALRSVHLAKERSSLNDFTTHAHKLAEALR